MFQGRDELRAQLVQLTGVVAGEIFEETASFRSEPNDDAAAIDGVVRAPDQPGFFAADTELDHAVMAKTEALSYISNGWGYAFRRSGNLQKQLMLLGMKANLYRSLFAELQKAAQGIAEIGQKAHLLGSGIGM